MPNYQVLDEVDRKSCIANLAAFMNAAWHIVEPGRPIVWNWHLDAICKHLEAIRDGLILNSLFTVPPGTTKSRAAGVYWLAHTWIKQPHLKFMFVGNSQTMAYDTSIECRRLLESDWYRHNFGIQWTLADDQNTKGMYLNSQGGHRAALGIGSSVTGKKGDIICVDDANDAEKVESAADRKRVIRRYENAIWDRVIDFATGRRVIIGQRTHVDDLIGHLKRQGGYFELRIPEEFDPSQRYTSPIGWTDPRSVKGELLRPHSLPAKLARQRKRSNLMSWQAKHNQEPRSREGIRFKKAWLDAHRWVYDNDGEHILVKRNGIVIERFHPRTCVAIYGTADGASSTKTSADWTVISAWIITPKRHLIWLGCRRIQSEIPEQPEILQEEYQKHSMSWCDIESVFANVALYQFAARTGITVNPVNPMSLDKLARATPAIIVAEAGELFLPEDEQAEAIDFPIDAVVDELVSFTGDPKQDEHDDVIDTLSYAVRRRAEFAVPISTNVGAPVPAPTPADGVGRDPQLSPGFRGGMPHAGAPMVGGTSWHGRR